MVMPRHFRHTGLVLVRASTDPGGLCLPGVDLHSGDGVETIGRAWLAQLWDRDAVRLALSVASPDLCEQIIKALSGAPLRRRQWRRLLVSVCCYVLRWQNRPTPFGLFAGITTATISATTRIKFGDDHSAYVRVDPVWLDEVISALEHEPAVLAEVSLVANNSGFARGDRFVIPKQLPTTRTAETDTADQLAAELGAFELALRCTRPVTAALAATRQPVHGRELITQLEHEFPEASPGQITTMLVGLVANHVLITSLRAPATITDPVRHLLDQLETLTQRAGLQEHEPGLVQAAEVRGVLRVLHQQMSTQDGLPGGPLSRRATDHRALANSDSAVSGVGDGYPRILPATLPRLGMDVAVDGQLDLPESVLREAENAASALLRLTRNPFGTAAWRDYHVRFRDRYGAGAVVPVRELVSDAGLGYPIGFLGAAREQPERALTDRDAVLQTLVQETVLDRRTEIALSESVIGQLAVGDHTELLPPERVELAFTLHSPSSDALGQGRFQLWVSGAPPASSSMAGRFAPLLDERDRDRLASSYRSDPAVMAAQLSFPPRRRHNDAVTRTPHLLPWLLPIAEYHPDTDAETSGYLDLDDLAVTATATRFFLIHRSSGQRIHAHVLHALETTVYTPPLVRFLAEIATARSAVFGPFDFGATRTLPFLPRLRFGRSVLTPARWLLHNESLPGPQASPRDWGDALATWRRRWRVPAHVVLCEGEQRLPLDLDEPTQRSLLRTRLRRGSTLELRESGEPTDQGWAGRACELVVPLTSTPPPERSEKPAHQLRPAPHPSHLAGISKTGTSATSGLTVPAGSSLLLAQLEGHPQRFDDILTDHLPRLYERIKAQTVRLWFRRRHDTTRPDTDHYLQIFLRLTGTEQYGTVAAHIAAWTNELRDVGLVAQLSFETAWVQAGKYGTDITTSEQVFAADSAAALAELTFAHQANLPIQAVAAVSMADLATGLAPTPETAWQWLTTVLPQHHGPLDHALREHTLQIAQHLNHAAQAAEYDHTQHEASMLTAWMRRRDALTAYRTRLERDPSSVLRALLHDHIIRTVAIDPQREQATNCLARAIALRAQALAQREQA